MWFDCPEPYQEKVASQCLQSCTQTRGVLNLSSQKILSMVLNKLNEIAMNQLSMSYKVKQNYNKTEFVLFKKESTYRCTIYLRS